MEKVFTSPKIANIQINITIMREEEQGKCSTVWFWQDNLKFTTESKHITQVIEIKIKELDTNQ